MHTSMLKYHGLLNVVRNSIVFTETVLQGRTHTCPAAGISVPLLNVMPVKTHEMCNVETELQSAVALGGPWLVCVPVWLPQCRTTHCLWLFALRISSNRRCP